MDTAELPRIRVYGDTAIYASRVTNTAHYRGQTFSRTNGRPTYFEKLTVLGGVYLTHITPVLEKGEESS